MTAKYFPPEFSVKIYLICLSIMMFISFIAFLLLWKNQRKEKQKSQAEQVIAGENPQSSLLTIDNDQLEVKIEDKNEEKFTLKTIMYLLIILWTSILLIGCIPSINSYSLNPYGASTFHYVLILCKLFFFYIKYFSKQNFYF